MAKEEAIETEGTILELLPNAMFKVKISNNCIIIGYTSGKMRKNRIRILVGDTVKVAITPYDKTKGRIIARNKEIS
ncbi:MAG: translation initiation factor IF-1 [Rickettsiales endosymbiont of Dermacentor nuttalli]